MDDALDVLHEPVEVHGELGDLVGAGHVEAGREVTLAFGDVAHAGLDGLQRLDDGVAQHLGGHVAQGHHDQAQDEHHPHALHVLAGDAGVVHDQHLVDLLGGVLGLGPEGGGGDHEAALLVLDGALAQGLAEDRGVDLGVGAVALLELHGHGLGGGVHGHHGGDAHVRVVLDELQGAFRGARGGAQVVGEVGGGGGFGQHRREAVSLGPDALRLRRGELPPRDDAGRDGQDQGQRKDGVAQLLPDA